MLDELRITGLGVIDEAVLPLGRGLTVVTGETGAGKTMVVTGLLLLFGGRADSARVRIGSTQAIVEGRVLIEADGPVAQRVRDAGGDLDDAHVNGDVDDAAGSDGADQRAELVLRRTVSAAGRSRAHVGGAQSPVSVLADLAEHLVAVHGQSEQLRLVRSAAQRDALDRYAGIDTADLATDYAHWRDAEAALADRTARAAELRRESDLLTYGLHEIDAADPQPGEAEELAAVASRLGHADALRHAARSAHDAILGNTDDPTGETPDVVGLLGGAGRHLAHQADDDPALAALAARLADVAALAADVGAELGAYADDLDADPGRLEQVETRRATLQALLRKYCDDPEPTTAGVLRWAEAARTRLADIDVSDEALAALRATRDTAGAVLAERAAEVSTRRSAAADELAAAATAELTGLAMPRARLEVQVRRRPAVTGTPALVVGGERLAVGPDGVDEVEVLLAPHPGAPPLPVARGASGGELSRVMLALEVCLATTPLAPDPVATFVFDEVDAGVGGRAAVEVGRRLARLAREHQVIVVTHLAQVAAFADRHVVVDKPGLDGTEPNGSTAGLTGGDGGGDGGDDGDGADDGNDDGAEGVTASDVRVVTGDERVGELARMLSGSDTATAREHARELLADAAASASAAASAAPSAAASPTPSKGSRTRPPRRR